MLSSFARRLASYVALSQEDFEAIGRLDASTTRVSRGKPLLEEGEPFEDMLVVERGMACRTRVMLDGQRQVLGYLLPGDVAGYPAMAGRRSTCTVSAVCEGTFLRVRRRDAAALATGRPAVARALDEARHVDACVLEQWLLNVGRRSAYQRLAHLVCEIRSRVGAATGRDVGSFDLPLTQSDLGDATALSVVHVNRTLQQLRADHLVLWRRGNVEVPSPALLEEAGEFDAGYLFPNGCPEHRRPWAEARDVSQLQPT